MKLNVILCSVGCAYGAYKTKDVNILRDIYLEMGEKRKQL
jgi:hypothetical protein